MIKYIETDKLKQMVEHKMDMQDTYLPAHFFDIVDDMPSADVVEVRHGRWINHGSFEVCSVCGEEQYGHDSGRYYCPNCGAKMDEVSKDE